MAPTIPTTFSCEINLRVALTDAVLSLSVLMLMKRTCSPSIPPASFTCFTASSAPASPGAPSEATGPDVSSSPPITISACDFVGESVSPTLSKLTAAMSFVCCFIVVFLCVGFLGWLFLFLGRDNCASKLSETTHVMLLKTESQVGRKLRPQYALLRHPYREHQGQWWG